MSLPLDQIIDTLRAHVKDATQLNAIAKDLIAAENEAKEEREAGKEPKKKNRFVIVLRADSDTLAKNVEAGWVLTVPEDDSGTRETLLKRVQEASKHYNESLKRGRASRVVRTFAQAFERVKASVIKKSGVSPLYAVKTRTPVEVVIVPREELGN